MAKSSSRKLWAMKLAGNLPNSANSSYIQSGRKKVEGVILGIDPSLRGTGLAVLEVRSGQHRLLKSLTVTMKSKATMPECLAEIYKSVSILIEDFNPNFVALEQTIFVQNVKTAQILGAARGAAIAAAAVLEKPVFEYPPLRVKQAVVGYGRASKHQVAHTVKQILALGDALAFDEADAAGVALCHAFTYSQV
jgi:crossover junction endodeoxyribonuclease RuvC